MPTALPPQVRVAIIGSGFAGLGMAIRLRQEGIDDFVVLERAGDLGGTWRDNSYPGCRCDVPSHLYSFSFAPNPDWSSTFSPQAEIWDYLRDCARRFGVMPHLRFGHEVTAAAWDEDARRWRIETTRGDLAAQVLVSGMGFLAEPKLPPIPGIESFEGTTFHSATWDHDHDLTGGRVAVVGTGASAIQFVPQIQPRVGKLHLFQRTAPWVMPRPDRPLRPIERRVYRAFPPAQRAMRAALYWARESLVMGFRHPRLMRNVTQRLAMRHLREQVPDPELRGKLTPAYTMGCKRILISDDYYPSLVQPNVEVVIDPVREVRAGSIVTADGAEREVDTIIFGTGFHVTDTPAVQIIRGREGRLLSEVWNGSPQAYAGTTIAGFPNFFMLVGPNTGLGHSSIVFIIESQLPYVLDALRFMDERDVAAVDVRPEVQAAFNRDVQEQLQGTVWNAGGCKSWYLDAAGKNTTLWPGFTWRYRLLTRAFDPAMYELHRAVVPAAVGS